MSDNKSVLKKAAQANAWTIGYEDYPHQNRCPFNFGKTPEEHTAYWAGWNQAATEIDRHHHLQGAARTI